MTKMKIHKTYIAIGLMIAFTLFFELAAHASETDQLTKITFNQPVQVPGLVLSAGTYLFKIPDTFDLNVVQIFNSDGTHLYATIHAIPTEASETPDDTTLVLAEQGASKPDLLLKWFYPGEPTGHEFLYSNRLEKEIAQDRQQVVVGNQEPITDSEAGGAN
jgi:hypothetical protein